MANAKKGPNLKDSELKTIVAEVEAEFEAMMKNDLSKAAPDDMHEEDSAAAGGEASAAAPEASPDVSPEASAGAAPAPAAPAEPPPGADTDVDPAAAPEAPQTRQLQAVTKPGTAGGSLQGDGW